MIVVAYTVNVFNSNFSLLLSLSFSPFQLLYFSYGDILQIDFYVFDVLRLLKKVHFPAAHAGYRPDYFYYGCASFDVRNV